MPFNEARSCIRLGTDNIGTGLAGRPPDGVPGRESVGEDGVGPGEAVRIAGDTAKERAGGGTAFAGARVDDDEARGGGGGGGGAAAGMFAVALFFVAAKSQARQEADLGERRKLREAESGEESDQMDKSDMVECRYDGKGYVMVKDTGWYKRVYSV